MMEFWGAMAVHVLAYYVFRNNPEYFALIMLGWIWPLRGFALIHEDMNDVKIIRPWHYVALATGGAISFALSSMGFSFLSYTLPFSLSAGLVGFSILLMTLRQKPAEQTTTPLQASVMGISSFFFLSCITFPFWGMGPSFEYGLFADLLIMIALAGSTMGAYMEFSKKQYVSDIQNLEKTRNEKLVGNSKYSELGMMAAGIAHEINNPLAVIQARTTQLLRIYRDPKKQKELADGLQQILYTSERINRTIQGVREFVHDERSTVSDIRLQDLIDDVLAFCGQRMKNHGVNLRFYGIDNLSVWGNKIQLEQIILNLLNNSFDAIEFLPDKWIELSAVQNDDQVQISVKDSGHGIPAEVAAHIMEPFYSTKDIGKGTGLGLALARGIAEKHGGTLKYQDGSGHTTFVLEIPKQPREDWGLPMVH